MIAIFILLSCVALVRNKTLLINKYVCDDTIDILAITLDPLPAKQIQQCLSSLVPIITAITNKSLEEGTMPSALKVACVHPLLKKPSLDRDMLCNYRPVSTLSLSHLSKVIEKVVALRLSDHY